MVCGCGECVWGWTPRDGLISERFHSNHRACEEGANTCRYLCRKVSIKSFQHGAYFGHQLSHEIPSFGSRSRVRYIECHILYQMYIHVWYYCFCHNYYYYSAQYGSPQLLSFGPPSHPFIRLFVVFEHLAVMLLPNTQGQQQEIHANTNIQRVYLAEERAGSSSEKSTRFRSSFPPSKYVSEYIHTFLVGAPQQGTQLPSYRYTLRRHSSATLARMTASNIELLYQNTYTHSSIIIIY